GCHGTTFAYGQSDSGKSFTTQRQSLENPSSQKGVIARAFEHIFEDIQCAENAEFLLRTSCLEIYNVDIQDLLGADTKQKLE
ncbi:KIF17 protein, partial [Panurus biarmicus]|nr:KIF17 protein [Panurus biarmicus]